MGTKMKGLLKGLRYISQIFEAEKEQEMQIGNPTDVKHVAHIGWDGPTWMSRFRLTPEFSSAPLSLGSAVVADQQIKENIKINKNSEDLLELPTSSPCQSQIESPVREKSGKSKNSRRQHSEGSSRHNKKDKSGYTKINKQQLGSDSPSNNLPSNPKKSGRKKSKDVSVGGSRRSKLNNANNNMPSIF